MTAVRTLVSGSVSIPVSTLPAGNNSITASYLGGGGFAASQSAPLTQTVSVATTKTSLTSSLNPAGTSQAVTFTAKITSQYGGTQFGLWSLENLLTSVQDPDNNGNAAAAVTQTLLQ